MTSGADTTPRMLPATIQLLADEARWDAGGRTSPTATIILNRGYELVSASHTNVLLMVPYVSSLRV